MTSNESESSRVDVRYDQSTVTFANQFLVTAGQDEMVLDLSSGVIQSQGSDVLPIHTRLALSYETAQRLVSVLQQVVAARRDTAITDANHPASGIPVATLPTLNASHVD